MNSTGSDARVLVCPIGPTARPQGHIPSYACSCAFYHSPEQINERKGQYDSVNTKLPLATQPLAAVQYQSSEALVGEWFSCHMSPQNADGWSWEGARGCRFVALPVRPPDPACGKRAPVASLTADGVSGRDVD